MKPGKIFTLVVLCMQNCAALLLPGCSGDGATGLALVQSRDEVPPDASVQPDAATADAAAPAPAGVVDPFGRVLPIQHVGLPASGVPPLGAGINPSSGTGGDGAAAVTQVGGWSTGPGAVRWHGGQWLVPYVGTPGASIMNVSCDVVPRADATDLIELVGSAGVIGSITVPATGLNIVIRAWILPTNGYAIPDGGVVMLRHSPRDAVTGAWTSAAQDMTVINCAVNSRKVRVSKLAAIGGTSVGAGGFQMLAGQLSGNWYPVTDGDELGVLLPVSAGERFESITASIYGNTAYTITMSARSQDDAFHGSARLGNEQTSIAQNSLQALTVVPLANDNSGNNEQVATSQRSYSLQFRAHVVGAPDGGNLFVGPITLVTSN